FITAQRLVGDDRIVGFSDFGSAVQALIAGDVDAVVIDDVAGQGYTGENSDQIQLIEEAIQGDDQLGFIFPRGSELRDAFNWALMSMAVDGTLNDVHSTWGLPPFLNIGQ
ncbi:MAG: transporter substrate-binding domain-containing protein, partial [Anaerolineae bacterium]|nr:transporter substrate-binding domain-containing protein [Anaerolineae bacterium]